MQSGELQAMLDARDGEIVLLKADRVLLVALYAIAKVCMDEYIAAAGGAAGITGSNVTLYSAAETAASGAASVKSYWGSIWSRPLRSSGA